MPKTEFHDGTTLVTASFLNKLYRTDGGHKHDGIDSDGHASKIDLRSEITAGPNGSFTIPVDNADVQIIQYDHAASGNAIIRTDALTLVGAPRDATRRAQAPLDRSLYTQNVAKVLLQAHWDGAAWVVDQSFNTSGAFVNEDVDLYGIAVQDFSSIVGVVIATIDSAQIDNRYSLRAAYNIGGALEIKPARFNGTSWDLFRDVAPPSGEAARINVAIW